MLLEVKTTSSPARCAPVVITLGRIVNFLVLHLHLQNSEPRLLGLLIRMLHTLTDRMKIYEVPL